MSTSKFGPGWSGNTQSSPAKDTPLPSKVNEGDACMNMPKDPLKGTNKQTTADMGEIKFGTTKPGKGTRGRAVGSTPGM